MKDLIVINKLLKIKLEKLIPVILPESELTKITSSIEKLNRASSKSSTHQISSPR